MSTTRETQERAFPSDELAPEAEPRLAAEAEPRLAAEAEPRLAAEAEPRLCFLARALDPASWAGEPPLPELDVEAALAKVLAKAKRQPAPAKRSGFGWTRALAAALLLVGGLTPWLLGGEGPARSQEASLLAGVSTAAVVYAEHSGASASLKG